MWLYEENMRLFMLECGFGPIEVDMFEDIDYNYCSYCGDEINLNNP